MSRPEPVVVTPAVLREWPLPGPGSGKGSRGQILVVGGSRSTPGAVRLAGEAALRAGAGKLALATVEQVAPALGVAVPEAGVYAVPAAGSGEIAATAAPAILERAEGADAVLVGPGLGDPAAAVDLLRAFVPDLRRPLVVDALGSAYLTEHPDGLHHLEGRAVLTVNPTELARTAGRKQDDVTADLLGTSADVAARCRVVVLCGAEEKYVVTPDGRSWSVQGGGPGLGVSGSGDVQAGIVAGLLARGADPEQAATWGAYLHARSGERLAARVGVLGYLARELPAEVSAVLAELQ